MKSETQTEEDYTQRSVKRKQSLAWNQEEERGYP